MDKRRSQFVGIENAEAKHRQDPRIFSIPRTEQRQHLEIGDTVKLAFKFDPPTEGYDTERMWVEVREITPDGYVGSLENCPRYIADLHVGDRVSFGSEHVAALWIVDEACQIPWGKFAIVSRNVTRDDAWPRGAVRREPPAPEWSGWTIYDGNESEDQRLQMDRFVSMSVDELIQRFPVLDSVLDEPVGTAWAWNDNAAEYQPANEQKPEVP